MRIARITPSLGTTLLSFLAGLAGLTLTPCFAEIDATTSQPSTAPPVELQATFSPGVRDVLKMVDAKVDAEVIKTYIRNSSVAYNPTATEIIALKHHGVPDDVITGLIQQGGEVRTQLAQSAAAAGQAAPPAATAPNTPQYGYGSDYGASMAYPASTYPAYSDYAYGYPYGGYPYYPYYYGYPYWYSWYWPFYSPFFFAFHDHHNHFHDGHSHDGHSHDGHSHDGHFHDGHSVAVHGHNGNWSGHSGPWATPASRGSVASGSVAGRTAFSARPTMSSIGGARTGGFTVRPTAFNGMRTTGFAPRSAGFAPRSAGFAPRSTGFAPRSTGFAPRSAGFAAPRSAGFATRSGGMAMRGGGGGGFAMHSGGGFGGGHGGGGHGGGGHR